jgi:hypothetical protein
MQTVTTIDLDYLDKTTSASGTLPTSMRRGPMSGSEPFSDINASPAYVAD